MLKLDNVKVQFKDQVAVDLNREIDIATGERVGIIGSNGAGKTTLLKAILGIVPYSGRIISDVPMKAIGVHMQQNEYCEMVPIKVIMEMILGHSLKSDPQVQELIDFFDFSPCLTKRWKHLSGGQKQRLTLILVMARPSPWVMFDEVTSGLDFVTRDNLMRKLVTWYAGKETTLLITSHYYAELNNLADKILLIDHGQVVDYGSKEFLFKKYCGASVLTFPISTQGSAIAANHDLIIAPNGQIAIRCQSPEEELSVTAKLVAANINYQRTNHDIELISLNALARQNERKEERKENHE